MSSYDTTLLLQAQHWLQMGLGVALGTVVQTWGSSPRPVGSMIVIGSHGLSMGSVSGGCIEESLLEYAQSCMANGDDQPRALTYGISLEDAQRRGLPCGGQLHVLLEPCLQLPNVSQLLDSLDQGKRILRRVHTAHAGWHCEEASSNAPSVRWDGQTMQHCLGLNWRLILVGANSIAAYVAQMASMCGFAVQVCDPRSDCDTQLLPASIALVKDMPDDFIKSIEPDGCTAIITLSHDPKVDDLALLEALSSHAFFTGALGSQRSQHARHERFVTHFNITAQQLQRLHGPVGLPIGSKSPPEIAVSIMAQLLQYKNALSGPSTASACAQT